MARNCAQGQEVSRRDDIVKIVQVITLYQPDFVGGATLVCERLARGLRDRGHEVAVFCGRPDPALSPYATTSWRVDDTTVTGVHVASGYPPLAVESYRHPEVIPAFERMLDDGKPDIVHIHSIQALGADLLAAASARRLPVVVTMHDWWWYCVRLFLVDPAGFICPPRVDPARCHCAPDVDFTARRAFLDRMITHAQAVLAPSRFLADAIVANGVPRQHVTICPNGVDAARRSPRRPRPLRFGYFGGADNRMKGLPTLLEAAMELDVGGWELVLHGASQAVIPTVVADRVRLRPAFSPDRLAAVLDDLDCLIVPSLMRESFSLVAREALAAGLPVVTSNSGGPEEIVQHGVNGLVFATASSRDLAAAMRRVVLEPDLRAMLDAGAHTTTVTTVAEQVDQLTAIYERALRCVSGAHDAAAVRGDATNRPVHDPSIDARAAPGNPRHVAFICGMDGAPMRYRVTNLRDQLALHDVTSEAWFWTSADIPAAIRRSDLVIVYRVPMSPWLRSCLTYARALGRPVIFSCDDLVFDEHAAPTAALALLPEHHRRGWISLCERYADTLRASDRFLGSTPALVDAARRLGVPGDAIANGLGNMQLDAAERASKQAAALPRDSHIRLAYLSGTNMHDLDFALVEPALATVLATFPTARLRLVGYLRPSERLAPYADRIERLPFLPWPEVFECLSDVDINLAPLASLGAFSDAKSAVKYLEAAVMGVPTIASPTPPFEAAIEDGKNGMLADTKEWARALTTLIEDGPLRRRLGTAARTDAFLHYGPASQADDLMALLEVAGAASQSTTSGTPTPPDRTVPQPPEAPATGRYDLEPAMALPGVAQPGSDASSPFLLAGKTVGQTFQAKADRLRRIDLCIGTDDLPHAHTLVVHLTDRPEIAAPDLRRVDIDTNTISNHAWIAAEFAPIEDSAGRTFYVWVEATGSSTDDAVTLWTYVDGWGETPPTGLHLDHRSAPGSLTFRTFHG